MQASANISAAQEAALQMLDGMGFLDRLFNAELLQLHNNNVQRVIEELVSGASGPLALPRPAVSYRTRVANVHLLAAYKFHSFCTFIDFMRHEHDVANTL